MERRGGQQSLVLPRRSQGGRQRGSRSPQQLRSSLWAESLASYPHKRAQLVLHRIVPQHWGAAGCRCRCHADEHLRRNSAGASGGSQHQSGCCSPLQRRAATARQRHAPGSRAGRVAEAQLAGSKLRSAAHRWRCKMLSSGCGPPSRGFLVCGGDAGAAHGGSEREMRASWRQATAGDATRGS